MYTKLFRIYGGHTYYRLEGEPERLFLHDASGPDNMLEVDTEAPIEPYKGGRTGWSRMLWTLRLLGGTYTIICDEAMVALVTKAGMTAGVRFGTTLCPIDLTGVLECS